MQLSITNHIKSNLSSMLRSKGDHKKLNVNHQEDMNQSRCHKPAAKACWNAQKH